MNYRFSNIIHTTAKTTLASLRLSLISVIMGIMICLISQSALSKPDTSDDNAEIVTAEEGGSTPFTAGDVGKFMAGELSSFDPIAYLGFQFGKQLVNAIIPMPDPQMQMLKKIYSTLQNVQIMQKELKKSMNYQFAKTDRLIEYLIGRVREKVKYQISKAATNAHVNIYGSNSTAGILAFKQVSNLNQPCEKDDTYCSFWKDSLDGWLFPPTKNQLVLSLPDKLTQDHHIHNKQFNQGNVVVINNREDIEVGDSIETKGSNPFTLKVTRDGNAVIKQGDHVVWSFIEDAYLHFHPLENRSDIQVKSVQFKNGQLVFKGKGKYMPEKLGLKDSKKDKKDYNHAIIEPDGTIMAYKQASYPYHQGPKGASSSEQLPWSRHQYSLFNQKIFSALKVFEQDGTTKKRIISGINLINSKIGGKQKATSKQPSTLDINSIGKKLNKHALAVYVKNLHTVLASSNLKMNNGHYNLKSTFSNNKDEEITTSTDLGSIFLREYQLYAQAQSVLNSLAQMVLYAYYYDPQLLENYFNIENIAEVGKNLDKQAQALRQTFIKSLNGYTFTTMMNGQPRGPITDVSVLPGPAQQIRNYSDGREDGVAHIAIPFTLKKDISNDDTSQYSRQDLIKLIKSGNKQAIINTNYHNFACALLGPVKNNNNHEKVLTCTDYKGRPGNPAQYRVVAKAFNINEDLSNTLGQQKSGYNFADIISLGKDKDGNYHYQISIRMTKSVHKSIVEDVFVSEDYSNHYTELLGNLSPSYVALPGGNWATRFHCRIPETQIKIGGKSTTGAYAGKDVRTVITTHCPIGNIKGNKSYQRFTMIPGKCVNPDERTTYTIDQMTIDYNSQYGYFYCSPNSSQKGTSQDHDKKLLDYAASDNVKTLVISKSGKYIKAVATTDKSGDKTAMTTNDKADWPDVRTHYLVNLGYKLRLPYYYKSYDSRSTSAVDSDQSAKNNDILKNESLGNFAVNKGGYLWSPSPAASDLWQYNAPLVKRLLPAVSFERTWQNYDKNINGHTVNGDSFYAWNQYCSQPIGIKGDNKLVTSCNGSYFHISSNHCDTYQLENLYYDKGNQLDQVLSCAHIKKNSSKQNVIEEQKTPLAKKWLAQGVITPDIKQHCKLSTLGLRYHKDYVSFYCQPEGSDSTSSKQQYVKTNLKKKASGNAYRYVTNAKVRFAKREDTGWPMKCQAYDYEQFKGETIVHCMTKVKGTAKHKADQYQCRHDNVKCATAPMYKTWQANDVLGNNIRTMCDTTAYARIVNQDNTSGITDKAVAWCGQLNANKTQIIGRNNKSKRVINDVGHYPADLEYAYATFSVDKKGHLKKAHKPVKGSYRRQCNYHIAGHWSNPKASTIWAMCGSNNENDESSRTGSGTFSTLDYQNENQCKYGYVGTDQSNKLTCVCPYYRQWNEQNNECVFKCNEGEKLNKNGKCVDAECNNNQHLSAPKNKCVSCESSKHWQPQTRTCVSCPGGKVWNGQQCFCPDGQHWNGQKCVSCPGGKQWNGQQCVCPDEQHWNGQKCVSCPGGKVWNGQQCVCPEGQHWNGQKCVSCPGGQIWNGKQCVCPFGGHWNGQKCVSCHGGKQWNGQQCVCPDGQHWNGQKCVSCSDGKKWNGYACVCPYGDHWNGHECIKCSNSEWDSEWRKCITSSPSELVPGSWKHSCSNISWVTRGERFKANCDGDYEDKTRMNRGSCHTSSGDWCRVVNENGVLKCGDECLP